VHHLIEIWFNSMLGGPYGYFWIVVLMAVGSTPIPLPAEAILPPAAFLAAPGEIELHWCHCGGNNRGRIWEALSCIGFPAGSGGL